MKITRAQLKQIIKEEIQKISEAGMARLPDEWAEFAPPEDIPAEFGAAPGPPTWGEIYSQLIKPYTAVYSQLGVNPFKVGEAASNASPDREAWQEFLDDILVRVRELRASVDRGEMTGREVFAQAIAEKTGVLPAGAPQ